MKTQVIKFHEDNLIAIQYDNTQYVVAKKICENIGLDWSYQRKKLQADAERWGVAIIAIPTNEGIQESICIPERKVFGWLMTIQPTRLKGDVKNKIIQYQNECDEVLNNYFNKGVAVNQNFKDTSAQVQEMKSKMSSLQNKLELTQNKLACVTDYLTPKMKSHIKKMVKLKVSKEPLLTYQGVYSQLNERFNAPKYDEIKQDEYIEVCRFLGFEPLEEYKQKSQAEFLSQLPKWLRTKIVPCNKAYIIYGDRAYMLDEAVQLHTEFN